MCRPIRAVASPLPQTCKRPNFCSDNDAGAKALAFLLRKDNGHGEEAGHQSQERIRVFRRGFMRMAHSAPIGASAWWARKGRTRAWLHNSNRIVKLARNQDVHRCL